MTVDVGNYVVNEWYLSKTSFLRKKCIQQTQIEGKKVVSVFCIPRFSKYYFRYISNMRVSSPTLEALSEVQYQSMWVTKCISLLNQQSLEDNTNTDDLIYLAQEYFHAYGNTVDSTSGHLLRPEDAIVKAQGTFESNWVKAVTDQLASKSGSKEYQALEGLGGNTAEEQAQYLFKHFSNKTPNSAVSSYFGLVERVKHAKITTGVIINLPVPGYIKEKLDVNSIDLVSERIKFNDSDSTVDVQYDDDMKLIFKILDEWLKLVNTPDMLPSVYGVDGQINGINSATYLNESSEIYEIYPVAASPKKVTLKFKRMSKINK